MPTITVRLRMEDVERIERLCGLPPAVPFSVKAHAALRALEEVARRRDARKAPKVPQGKGLRVVPPDEPERVRGGA
jgi:hypothetical protein